MRGKWKNIAVRAGLAVLPCLVFVPGCGTTRATDTPRSATEELLVTHSIDEAVGQLNLSCLAGTTVFLDSQYLGEVAYKGYLTSALRQQLVACGCCLAPDIESAQVVLEARAGSVATTRNDSLIGIPATVLPAGVPGAPPVIPEIALIKKTIQTGVVRVTVFAYRVDNGAGIWQSGAKENRSRVETEWYFGLGPYRSGDRAVTGSDPERPPLADLHDAVHSDDREECDVRGPLSWEAFLGELPPPKPAQAVPPVPEGDVLPPEDAADTAPDDAEFLNPLPPLP